MKAYHYLSQVYHIRRKIRFRQERIVLLNAQLSRSGFRAGNDPVKVSLNVTAGQDAVIRLVEAKEELEREVARLEAKKQEITDTIAGVEDPMQNAVLELRYLNGRSFDEIAEILEYTERWIYASHRQALREVQRILDAREKSSGT